MLRKSRSWPSGSSHPHPMTRTPSLHQLEEPYKGDKSSSRTISQVDISNVGTTGSQAKTLIVNISIIQVQYLEAS